MKMKLVWFIKKNKELILLTILYSIFWSVFYFEKIIKERYILHFHQIIPTTYIFLGIVLVLLLLTIIYIYFFKKINNISFKKLFLLSIFINLALSLAWPIATSDILGYMYYGRIFSVFKESPYISIYNNFSFDPFFYFLKNIWIQHLSPYGPVFTYLSSFFSLIFKNDIILNMFFLKLFLGTTNIINGYLIYKLTKNKTCFYLYAFNPLIIFELAVNSHNDSLLILLILFSFLFFKIGSQKIKDKEKIKKYIISFFFLILSVLTKFISLIFVPIFVIITTLNLKEKTSKIKLLGLYIFTFFGLTLLLYEPLINNVYDIIRPIFNQSSLSGFYSPLIIILGNILQLFTNNFLPTAIIISKAVFVLSFFLILFGVLFKKWPFCQKNLIKEYTWGIITLLSLFYTTFFSWILPWYFTLLIALILLNYREKDQSKFLLYSIFFITIYGILYYITLR